MATETMDEFMMIINDCYPVSAYKKHYLTARCVLNEAKKLEPTNDDDIEKAMWICALLDDLKQVPVGRFEHTFEYKDISFDSAEFIREAFPQKELLDTIKKWFLAQYPDVAKFGTIEVDAQNEDKPEEPKSQNAVPVNEVPYFNDVQTPAVNVLQ